MTSMQHMPLFVREYLVDTMHLSPAESGIYLHLLMHAWIKGGELPDDDKQLASIARASLKQWQRAKPVIAAFWTIQGGVWKNKRLTKELQYVTLKLSRRSLAGAKGGRQRVINQQLRSSNARDLLKQPTPTPTPIEDTDRSVLEDRGSGGKEADHSAPNGASSNGAKKGVSRKACRLPEGWEPEVDDIAVGYALGLEEKQARIEFEKFKDHWAAQPGSRGVKLNWNATFRNWLRRAADDAGRRQH